MFSHLSKIQAMPRPQHTPYDSPWTIRQRLTMLGWSWVWSLLCAWTPKPLNRWRVFWLRIFGATISGNPFVHPRALIEIPWNLTMEDRGCLGDRAHAYSLGRIIIRARATVAQEVYLCAGTHDFSQPALPLVVKDIEVGEDSFIGARAFLMPGVKVGKRAVVGACAVVTREVKADDIVAGNPARVISTRHHS